MDILSLLGIDTTASVTSSISYLDIIIVLFGTFALSSFIAFVYKKTYTGSSYNQNYVHSLIILSIIIAIVMCIVGSNVARAFTMAGALSIIRFRNNIKDTRDIGFIFFALAIGMAMGTQFYALGLIGTFGISAIFYVLNHFDLFKSDFIEQKMQNQILKIEIQNGSEFSKDFAHLIEGYESEIKLQSVTSNEENGSSEISYKIKNKGDIDVIALIQEIKQINGNRNVQFIT